MNKNKSITNEKLAELCYLCILVNNQTDYCVFMNLSGHVNNFDFSIRESRANYQRVIVSEEFYFDMDAPAKINSKLDKVIDILSDVLKTNSIDYSKLKAAHSQRTYQVFRPSRY